MPNKKYLRVWRNTILPLLGLIIFAAYQYYFEGGSAPNNNGSGDAAALVEAFEDRRSGVWVEVPGKVVRTLADDQEGSRHQRFILSLGNDHTVLVAHNIDIADRVPLGPGDSITLRGRYEWNERGGVIHWTHLDSSGSHAGGWIMHMNKRYR